MRMKQSYEDITNAPNEQVKANPRKTCGINIQNLFCALHIFDGTNLLLEDIMYTLLKDVVQCEATFGLLYICNGSSETSNKQEPMKHLFLAVKKY